MSFYSLDWVSEYGKQQSVRDASREEQGGGAQTSLSGFSKGILSSVIASWIMRNDWMMLLKTTGFHSSFSVLLKPVA